MSGCSTASAQAYENCGAPAQGLLSYNANDPNAAAIAAAVASSKPANAPSGYAAVCEAMLRAGGLIYYKSNPGDCGAPPSLTGITSGQIAGLSGQAASGVTGVLGAAGFLSGAATLGIGTAITGAVEGIETIFSHHAEAVANEQATICSVAGYFNAAKKQIDAACRAGQISPDAACAYLTQVCNQAKSGLASIMKSCNAACVYQAICQAFINFAHTYYDSIAPTGGVFAQQPGGAPSAYGTPPGGVTVTPSNPAPAAPVRSTPASTYAPAGPSASGTTAPNITTNQALPGNVGAVDYLNLGYNQPTGQAAQRADVPSTSGGVNWSAVAGIAAVIALIFTLARAKG